MFLKICQNSQENTCGRVSFLGLRPATLLKKRLWHRCFPVNFAKFSRTFFLQNLFISLDNIPGDALKHGFSCALKHVPTLSLLTCFQNYLIVVAFLFSKYLLGMFFQITFCFLHCPKFKSLCHTKIVVTVCQTKTL